MKIFVDIDETICYNTNTEENKTKPRDYRLSEPIRKNIESVNKLYDEGHEITYWTARGTGSGIDWTEVTKQQFEKWGVKYHELKFGKPIYDLFIDDKNISTMEWEKGNL